MVCQVGDGDTTVSERPALLPLAAAVLKAVRDADIRVADRVLICGSGLVADLAEQAARLWGGRITKVLAAQARLSRVDRGRPGDANRSDDAGRFDVLIDTTADPAVWSSGLGLLRDQGRALLLLPPGAQVHPFDFYPAVHRRSLSVLARRVPEVNAWSATDEDAVRVAGQLIRESVLTEKAS